MSLNWPRSVRYALAVGLFFLGLAARFAIAPQEDGLPFLTFYPVILFSFFLLGPGAGAVTACLSGLAGEYFFIPPYNSLALVIEPAHYWTALFFALTSSLMGWVISRLHRTAHSLYTSEQDLRAILENLPLMVFVKDAKDLRFVRFNQAGESLLGIRREEMLGKTDYDFFPPEQAGFFVAKDRETLRSGQSVDVPEEAIETKHGLRWLHTRKVVVRADDGTPRYLLGISEDISQRKLAEEALRDSEARNAAFLENSATAAWLKDEDGRFVYMSRNCERRFGVQSGAWLGKSGDELFPGDIAERLRQSDLTVLATGRPIEVVEEAVEADGSRSWWLSSKFLLTDARGRRYVGGLGVDITRRKQIEEELEQRVSERTGQVRRLAAELEAASVRERTQIARDLHDDLGQTLAAMQIRLSKLLESDREDVRAIANEFAGLLAEANRATHSLAAQLAPPVLYELGLIPALEWLAEELESGFDLHVAIENDGAAIPLPQDVRSIVYRAVRELLINVAKHAGVNTATVRMECKAGALIVTVLDEGGGIGPRPNGARKGFGLAGVRERMSYIGGSLDVQGNAGGGTQAILTVPLPDDKAQPVPESA